ncbi:MAG: hypothetical protein ACYC6V_09295 [Bacillota bacterium]
MKISEIELLELNEALKGYEACIEKAGMVISQCEDNDVRHLVERTNRMLQQHYEEMMRLVDEVDMAEDRPSEGRRSAPAQPPQAPGYTTHGWSGPSYGTTYGGVANERKDGGPQAGHIKT